MAEQENDLDETRRLLYMALAANWTDQYELTGTLVNALVHHQNAGEPAPSSQFAGKAMDNVIAAISGTESGQVWVREQIARITRELGS